MDEFHDDGWETASSERTSPFRGAAGSTHQETHQDEPHHPPPQSRRRYKPRTCRICLDVVNPTFDQVDPDIGAVRGLFTAAPKVRYQSDDPELGRLICPCKCKGTQKYVHEGCLRAWRLSAPVSDRHYWECPTCRFRYRIERLQWGAWLASKVTQAFLTAFVMFICVFLLGFVADPIINFWVDPFDTLTGIISDIDGLKDWEIEAEEEPTWYFHFLKGFFSLGLLGFIKNFVAMAPMNWFNIRIGGGGNRRGGGGRNRLENISWVYILLGVLTALGAIWKLVSSLCERMLDRASNRIIEVQQDDGDEDSDDEEGEPESRKDI